MNEIEKAIETLMDFSKCVRVKADGAYSTNDFVEARDLAISALKAQQADAWIPLSKKLPEDGKKLLVSIGNEVYRATRHEGWWYVYYPQGQKLVSHVDAWKPLPEPWKEEQP